MVFLLVNCMLLMSTLGWAFMMSMGCPPHEQYNETIANIETVETAETVETPIYSEYLCTSV